jgi:hypothetical protein
LTQAAPVRPLAIAMIEPSFRTPLVAPVGGSPLLAAGLFAALGTAVAMAAVTVRADEENRLAALTKAKPLPQNRFAVNHRHASSQAGDWTTAVVSWQVRTSSVWFTCRMVAEHGTLPLERQGSSLFPALRQDTSFS